MVDFLVYWKYGGNDTLCSTVNHVQNSPNTTDKLQYFHVGGVVSGRSEITCTLSQNLSMPSYKAKYRLMLIHLSTCLPARLLHRSNGRRQELLPGISFLDIKLLHLDIRLEKLEREEKDRIIEPPPPKSRSVSTSVAIFGSFVKFA
ncbi:hypothetical protein SDJN03_12177, partial [Cucurbita argyrosperma subsp. sororia]